MRNAEEQDTAESSPPPSPEADLGTGPPAWEAWRVRSFWHRVERGMEEGRPLSGPPGERVRVDERPRPLPPAPALEDLLRDLLDAACGPLVRPGSRRGDQEQRRRAALRRLVRDLLPGRRPVHPARWALLEDRALEELNRRRPHVPDPEAEAVLRAALLALRDHRVTDAPLDVEALSRAFRSGARDAYASDLVGPDWRAESEARANLAARRTLEDRLRLRERDRVRGRGEEAALLESVHVERALPAILERARLSDAEAEVWDLHYEEGLHPKEIAERLGKARGTAAKQLHDARRKIREAVRRSA